ncbi:MAG: DUF58 domain-containing protein [Treponema sp.]|nr:DUF58 domain-containing protein [Treponema sp.]
MKPGPGLFAACLLWLLLAAAAYFFPFLTIIWIFTGLALIPVLALDFLFLFFFCDRLKVNRVIKTTLCQGVNAKVRLVIGCANSSPLIMPSAIRIFDLYPASMEPVNTGKKTFPAVINRKLFQKGRAVINMDYMITPAERGQWFFKGTQLLLSSVCRFWELKVFHQCESSGKTYPDFNKLKAGADLRGLLEKTGVKNIRRRGQGMEFRSLRDYQDGDSVRDIDWRAVSRRPGMDGYLKLIVREYQEEQDQQVLFLLDSGYRLHKRETGNIPDNSIRSAAGISPQTNLRPQINLQRQNYFRTQFDSALEAVLLLAWVSLKHGDSVAAASFGSREDDGSAEGDDRSAVGDDRSRWLFPGKGMAAFSKLMNGLYDLKSSPSPSSPFSCLEEALGKLKRRTFIIIISNFREEDGESLSWILKRVNRRHLLLLVSLKESEAGAIAARKPVNADEALETAAAFSYLNARRELQQKWEHLGLLTLETSSQNLAPALINRYLQVKRSGRL